MYYISVSLNASVSIVIITFSYVTELPSHTNEIQPQFLGPILNVTVAVGRDLQLPCAVSSLGSYKVGKCSHITRHKSWEREREREKKKREESHDKANKAVSRGEAIWLRADEWKSEIGICSRERITSSSGLPFNRLYFSLYCLFFFFSSLLFLCLVSTGQRVIPRVTWSSYFFVLYFFFSFFSYLKISACALVHLSARGRLLPPFFSRSFLFFFFSFAQSFIKCDHFVCLFLSWTHLLHPKHKVAWLRVEDKGILTIHDHVITRNYRINLIHAEEKQFTLLIKNIQPSDAGGYMCQVSVCTFI